MDTYIKQKIDAILKVPAFNLGCRTSEEYLYAIESKVYCSAYRQHGVDLPLDAIAPVVAQTIDEIYSKALGIGDQS